MRWTALASFLLLGPLAGACLILGSGKAPAAVAGETAFVVWDAKTKTERFVRTATFTRADGPIGFLVPTPTPPKLKAMPAFEPNLPTGATSVMKTLVAPRIVEAKRPVYRLSEGWSFGPEPESRSAGLKTLNTGAAMYNGDVDLLERGEVGGYDTAVLRAGDPKALLAWLKTHGFESDARLEAWLRPYTERGWAVTAFRFKPTGLTFGSDPMCLTFQTDRPFYPYREPLATNAPATRSLRVFLVAPERRKGQLDGGAWPTKAEYAGPLKGRPAWSLEEDLEQPRGTIEGQWLTSFLDKRATRPDSELYFDVDPDAKPIEPPPVVHIVDDPVDVPKGLVAVGVVGVAALGWGVVELVRRRR